MAHSPSDSLSSFYPSPFGSSATSSSSGIQSQISLLEWDKTKPIENQRQFQSALQYIKTNNMRAAKHCTNQVLSLISPICLGFALRNKNPLTLLSGFRSGKLRHELRAHFRAWLNSLQCASDNLELNNFIAYELTLPNSILKRLIDRSVAPKIETFQSFYQGEIEQSDGLRQQIIQHNSPPRPLPAWSVKRLGGA